MGIDYWVWLRWKDTPILHDEDNWNGKYQTWGEMWEGKGYVIELNGRPVPQAELQKK